MVMAVAALALGACGLAAPTPSPTTTASPEVPETEPSDTDPVDQPPPPKPKFKSQPVKKNGTVTRAEWNRFDDAAWSDDGCPTVKQAEQLFGAKAKRTGDAYGAFREYEWRGTKRSGVARYVITFHEGCHSSSVIWPWDP